MKMRASLSWKFTVMVWDCALFIAAHLVVLAFRFRNVEGSHLLNEWFLGTAFVFILCLYLFGTYSVEELGRPRDLLLRVLGACIASVLILQIIIYLGRWPVEGVRGRGILIGGSFLAAAIVAMSRLVEVRWRGVQQKNRRILLLGTDMAFESLRRALRDIGFAGGVERRVIESFDSASASDEDADLLLIDREFTERSADALNDILKWRFAGGKITELSSFYESVFRKVQIDELRPSWFLSYEGFDLLESRFQRRIKRLSDLVLAILVGVLALPLVALSAVFIKLDDGGPVFFRQTRTGLDGDDFTILKLRTMRIDAERAGAQWAAQNDPRITRIGNFLRKTRLDELPQLWNVLRGEMSFVGPRPERPEFNAMLEEKIPFYGARHLMPPGLTGWAQVMYPYGASVEDAKEKLQYDLYYIKNYSLWLDLRILLRTARVVLFGKGR